MRSGSLRGMDGDVAFGVDGEIALAPLLDAVELGRVGGGPGVRGGAPVPQCRRVWPLPSACVAIAVGGRRWRLAGAVVRLGDPDCPCSFWLPSIAVQFLSASYRNRTSHTTRNGCASRFCLTQFTQCIHGGPSLHGRGYKTWAAAGSGSGSRPGPRSTRRSRCRSPRARADVLEGCRSACRSFFLWR